CTFEIPRTLFSVNVFPDGNLKFIVRTVIDHVLNCGLSTTTELIHTFVGIEIVIFLGLLCCSHSCKTGLCAGEWSAEEFIVVRSRCCLTLNILHAAIIFLATSEFRSCSSCC